MLPALPAIVTAHDGGCEAVEAIDRCAGGGQGVEIGLPAQPHRDPGVSAVIAGDQAQVRRPSVAGIRMPADEEPIRSSDRQSHRVLQVLAHTHRATGLKAVEAVMGCCVHAAVVEIQVDTVDVPHARFSRGGCGCVAGRGGIGCSACRGDKGEGGGNQGGHGGGPLRSFQDATWYTRTRGPPRHRPATRVRSAHRASRAARSADGPGSRNRS